MKENIEEDIENINRGLYELADSYELHHASWAKRIFESIKEKLNHILSDYKRVLKENEQLKQMLDERFIYVTGARTVYARLMQLDKEIIVKDDLKLRNEIKQLLKENEELKHKYDKALSDVIAGVDLDNTYIPKQKIKDKIEELNKKEKQELKGTKGQDRYSIKQQYMYQKNILQDLLESEGK